MGSSEKADSEFQHTAARRRLSATKPQKNPSEKVSTHSRPKAAGILTANICLTVQFQHTAARRRLIIQTLTDEQLAVSTHSRPKAAAFFSLAAGQRLGVSTHSRPKAAGKPSGIPYPFLVFQHTAARRRLILTAIGERNRASFNTQPPEGGCKALFYIA